MTKKSWRRAALSGGVIAALTVSTLLAPAAHAVPVPDADVLLHYDFAEPGVVRDVSGSGRDGVLAGTGATVADGVLTLPGGAAGSAAGHVRLPSGVFDGRDTVTISTWLRNETGSGNYAALFFGSATPSPPAQYWLLNPANPQGRMKSVITDGSSPGAPWTTERGISPTNAARGVAGPLSTADWAMYTTVITPSSITGYLDGEPVGTVPTTRTVSQFGTGLIGYIGRSTYNDPFFRGAVDDLVVTASALDPQQVAELYYSSGPDSAARALAALGADADGVGIPAETVTDLALPDRGGNGATIAWSSSNPAALSADGAVTRPAAGSADAAVTLTATLTLGGQAITRDYTVTVPAIDAQRDLERTAAGFDLGIAVVTGDIVLADEFDGADVTWQSSRPSVVAADGTVTPSAAETEVTLRATFSLGGATASREFRVTVRAAAVGRVVSSVRAGDTPLLDVLHLAIGRDGQTLTALNHGKGVLYPRVGVGTARFANPTLFRHPDGTFGLIASDDASSANVFVYRSSDLVTFTDPQYVRTNDRGIVVSRADVEYDNGIRAYRVVLRSPDGTAYATTSADLATFSPATRTDAAAPPAVPGLPAGAIEAAELRLTAAELDVLGRQLGRIVNTTVDAGDDIEIEAGGPLELPERVDLGYSDGSAKQLGVEWDTSGVDVDRPGTYTVTGTVSQPDYGDEDGILVRERADPWVLRDDTRLGTAEYYLTGSYPTTQQNPGVGYDRIVLRRSDTIDGLTTAQEEVLLWARNAAGTDTSNGSTVAQGAYRYFWAPELHRIGGDWYILFTSSRGGSVWDIRPAIMRAPGDSDPMVASNWQELGYVIPAAGDDQAFRSFSLDMTYFEANGRHYMVWAEKPGASELRIAEIDPADPQRLTNRSVRLSTPEFAWEQTSRERINEGAAVITSDDEVFMFFSASEVNETYSVGMLRAPLDGDLMDPATWTKTGYPLLTSDDFDHQQLGPGHNSFTIDADGNPVIVYHARPARDEWLPGADGGLNDPSRHARVKTVHFAADGSAVLNQTREEELAPENRTVTLQVTVRGETPRLEVTTVVSSRCVAGRVVQVFQVRNGERVPVDVTISTPHGTTRFAQLGPDRGAARTISVRAAAIAAGAATVVVTAGANGETAVTGTETVPYDARHC